jgi:hypothetical protein
MQQNRFKNMGYGKGFAYQSNASQNVIRGVEMAMTLYPNRSTSKWYIYKNSNYDFIQVRVGT